MKNENLKENLPINNNFLKTLNSENIKDLNYSEKTILKNNNFSNESSKIISDIDFETNNG